MIAIGLRMEGAFFQVRVLNICGILAAGKCDLAHDNRLAKAWSYTHRRLTHHLVLLFLCFYVFLEGGFLLFATGQTPAPILTVHGSKDVFWRKEVPFGG